jgi:2-polyprenyl-6-methoxyphenol hydroxylase-like FAD-dependent oxidoreductase
MTRSEVPVLIVGAGPVGLMAAILLARHGIEARLIDRRVHANRAPAAHVVNARTFEICRAAGVDAAAIAAAAGDPRDAGQVIWLTKLAGDEIGRLPFERQGEEALRFTPTPLRNLPQHRFETILRNTLKEAGAAEVAYGQQWESAEQDASGVLSRVRDLESDTVHEIHSRFVIACDGAGSRVRKSLGIEMSGPPRLQSFLMIHFAADLREIVRERPGILYWIVDPELGGTFVAHDIDREWVYMRPIDPDRESEADYQATRCAELVRAAIGADCGPLRIETISSWTMSAQVAERIRAGRIFLAGDSAHRFPPTGGLGLNSGVQDAHALAWRLAAVEAGHAGPSLLDSYESERLPVARDNAAQSLRNAMKMIEIPVALGIAAEPTTARMRATLADPEGRQRVEQAIAAQAEHFDMLGLQLGFRYAEGALIQDDALAPLAADRVREFVPSGCPGARCPHAWWERDGRRGSTLDLLAFDGLSLVTSSWSDAWATAVEAISDVPIRYVSLEREGIVDAERWRQEAGVAHDGALLVRPDQHVAWRVATAPAEAGVALRSAIDRVLGRDTLVTFIPVSTSAPARVSG